MEKHLRVGSPWPPGPTPLTHGPLRDRSPSSSGRLSAAPSRFVLGLIAAHGNRHVFPPDRIGRLVQREAAASHLDGSRVALETTKSTTTTTTQKRQENYWLCRSLLFCFRCHLRSMFVKKKENVKVVFVKYYETDVQKTYEMKSFMVVKSFTLLNYFTNGKEKQEKKRTLLRLLQRSCFVTVSCICRYFCWGTLDVNGARKPVQSVCNVPLLSSLSPYCRTIRAPPFPTRLLLQPGNQ